MLFIHKFIFISISLIGIAWTCFALETAPFGDGLWETIKITYIICGTVSFWGGAYILGAQYFYIRFIYKDKLLKKYALSIQKDLVVSFSTAIALSLLYWNDAFSYDFNGIDLGFVGVPFGFASIYVLFQLFSVKIAGEKLRRKPLYLILLFVTLVYCGIYYLLLENLNGEYSTIKAAWVQISVMCFSFVIFMILHLKLVFVQEGKISMPSLQKEILTGLSKDAGGLLSEIEGPIEEVNRNLQRRKSVQSAQIRKKQKNNKSNSKNV